MKKSSFLSSVLPSISICMYLIQASLGSVSLSADFSLLQLNEFAKRPQQFQIAGGSDVVVARQLH